jgi:hypothetical protein
MPTDRIDPARRWRSPWGTLRARLHWPCLNATPLSPVEVILAILAAAFLLVPEVRDLGYSPYSIEMLLAACASALLMVALVVFHRFLPVIGAIFIGMAFVSFLDLYFFTATPLVILAATIILTVGLVTNLRESIIRFFAAFSIVFAFLVVVTHSDSLLSPRQPRWDQHLHAGSNNQPAVIHLVLDEFMGSNGLKKAARVRDADVAALENFFTRRGFRIFRNARSSSGATWFSFNNFLTGEDKTNITKVPPLANLAQSEYYLKTNSYFDKYRNLHYSLHSVYSDVLRLCPSEVTDDVSCRVYTLAKRGSLLSRYSSSTKRSLELFVLALAADLSNVKTVRGVYFYHWLVDTLYRLTGYTRLTVGSNEPARLGPVLASLEILDQLKGEIQDAERGQLYFAHLLLPHSPWALNESCQLADNSAQTEQENYWGQVKCLVSRLNLFFKAVEENPALHDAIILVHGDHGARFIGTEPPPGLDEDAPSMLDIFNAFVAFRAPGYEAGVDNRRVNLADVIHWELKAAGVDAAVLASPQTAATH